MSPDLETNMSPIRGAFSPSGDNIKIKFLAFSDCSAHFTSKRHMLKQVGKTPVFNPLHQRNSLLRLVQRCGTDPGIVRLKTWKKCLFSS